ncbi:uncharacterized protein HMPREF1541_03463 [Cyphellophora europaea CBS 101466]|uniref:alpha-glucosidase n=1 Tax=Cyphellophora europaea (strain CBS 101466) TaxID=1220924 RepID=W2RYK6_CYPE1|nr:uncharacterized protein HMPREF1541_03463 [Cyphellophora europaea CBS 101466]ETN41527.1 hypothetical protein HMPREF1541_03463 [Cyphellophora europaea CBS 101466]
MPQQEEVPTKWARKASSTKAGNGITLESKSRQGTANFTFEAIRPGLFRTQFWTAKSPLPPYPNCEEPKTQPTSTFDHGKQTESTIDVDDVQATIDFTGAPLVSLRFKDKQVPIHSDLPDRSYVLDGEGTSHYMNHDRQALHVGLGEKAAPMDLTARPFILSATDCFGYEAYRTDPMYKHVPLLIKATPEGVVGVFSTSHARGFWSVGSEIDGLWGHFKVYRQEYGGLQEYLMVGRTLKDVVRLYAEVVGYPLLAPRWAFGYLSGGYKYCAKDNPPSHVVLAEFAEKLKEHDIPCSAHQMSSGYSIADVEPKVRNVFTWNKHRFPDPEGFLEKYHQQGIRLLSNIKPFILSSHPDFEYLKKNNGMFTDPVTGEMGTMKLWSAGGGESGLGGHLDFTSKAAFDWWCEGVQKLKKQGVDAMWNDNNEYTLPDDNWTMALNDERSINSQERNHVGLWGRALHCELMAKASYQGLLKAAPNERPFVLTRSGTPGTFRYAASSWSGDNMTSWEAMKGANAISLTAGLSGLHCFGHDIGGFEGPQPSPELLLRWVQLGIHSPRFAINCFKTSPQDNQAGEVIEPWMYPEIIPNIRDAIKRRYEILPYIYSLALEGHLTAAPPQRWVGWGYESDPEVWTKFLKNGEEQYWFGDSLMVGGVYQPGETKATLYLPRKNDQGEKFDYGFVNTNAPYEYLPSGQWVTVESSWRNSIPILAKIGGAVPVGKNVQTRTAGEKGPACEMLPEDDYRGVEIFPPKGSSHGQVFSSTWYDDDGTTPEENISSFTVTYTSSDEKVTVGFHQDAKNSVELPWLESLTFILLPEDQRFIVSEEGVPLTRVEDDCRGRSRYVMKLSGHRTNGVNGVMVNGHK